MQKKKLIRGAILLCVSLLFSTIFVSCSNNNGEPGDNPIDTIPTVVTDTIPPVMVDTTSTDTMKLRQPMMKDSSDTAKKVIK